MNDIVGKSQIMAMSVQLVGLFALLLCTSPILRAEGAPSAESKHVAKYGKMPFQGRYLYPGKGAMSVEWLSLPEERIMALTFDDGPDARDLEITDLLKEHHIPASFFYIGNKAKAMPEIVKEIQAGSYEIGYHSYQHQRMSFLSHSSLLEDFRRGKAVMAHLGVTLTWFRPPYGDFNNEVVQTATEQGLETILWTIDSRDWAGISVPVMTRKVIQQFHPGAVLLFHSTHANTLQALPEIVTTAEQTGYRFVSLGEWRKTVQTAHCRVRPHYCPVALPTAATMPENMAAVPGGTR